MAAQTQHSREQEGMQGNDDELSISGLTTNTNTHASKQQATEFKLSVHLHSKNSNAYSTSRPTILSISCRQITSRRIFSGDFTVKQLQNAGFVGVRSARQLSKAKNLIENAFSHRNNNPVTQQSQIDRIGNDHDEIKSHDYDSNNNEQIDSLFCDIIIDTRTNVMNRTEIDVCSDLENDNDNDDGDDNYNEQVHVISNPSEIAIADDDSKMSEILTDSKHDDENDCQVMLIHIIREDQFALFECRLILDEVKRSELQVLKEIVSELQIECKYLRTQLRTRDSNEINHWCPKGTIVMWSGSLDAVPNGWVLCDGTQNTPDLRGKFILGCDATNGGNNNGNNNDNAGNGGAQNQLIQLPIGSTGGSKQHSHDVRVANTALTLAQLPNVSVMTKVGPHGTYSIGGGGTCFTTCTQVAQGQGQGHSHTATCENSSHMPPYIVLAYIMKL